jgi:hypothetical protein
MHEDEDDYIRIDLKDLYVFFCVSSHFLPVHLMADMCSRTLLLYLLLLIFVGVMSEASPDWNSEARGGGISLFVFFL